MKIYFSIILIFILSNSGTIYPGEIKKENLFAFGIDYNSLLYEFEENSQNSYYYNLGLKGFIKSDKNLLNYNFSFLYPFSSDSEKKPLNLWIGKINLKKFFPAETEKKFEFSLFINFKNSEKTKGLIPVEEETYNFYGIDNSLNLFSDFKLKFGLNFLKTKNYEIFQNNKFYFGFRFEKERNKDFKFFSDLNFSHYRFDEKILVIPSKNNIQPPVPYLKNHRENVYSFDLGFEYVSFYIFDLILFYQKKDSTIEDLSNKSAGIEGVYSINFMKNLNLVLAFRYEKRWLSKKYTFFEPNILTEIGTSYIYLKINKNINSRNSINITFGRFVHDAREDFFETEKARYKISLFYTRIL